MKKTFYNKVAISIIGCLFMVLGGLVNQGWAMPFYTPTVSDIASWTLTKSTDNSGVPGGQQDVFGNEGDVQSYQILDFITFARYSGDFEFDTSQYDPNNPAPYYEGGAAFGSTDSIDLSGYGDFKLRITNTNESPWYFALYVSDGTNTFIGVGSTALTSNPNQGNVVIPVDETSILSLNLQYAATNYGVDLTNAYIGFAIGNELGAPGKDNDYTDVTFETRVTSVPEPATILLFGTGLIGLAGVARKKVKKA